MAPAAPAHGGVFGATLPPDDRSPICHAPFVAMEFDAFGDVQACCASALYPLGNVGRSTLREIWEGPRAQAMRDALTVGDLSYGCSVCRYRLTYGYGDLARDYYDNFPLPAEGHEWPFSLQFSLHNTCNLACVMCGADRSSTIRSQRSNLPPLAHAYTEPFFEQIVPFLAHAGAIDFSGGEPFLVTEHGRIWDLLIELDHRPLCSLTTNGTVWNARAERVLDTIDHHITVSVDGMTAETFESIRVGAGFDEVMANIDRFRAYTRERGTIMTMSWSLMRQNWHELGAAARFCEERGIALKVQTVIEPEFGLQRLPTPELGEIVAAMEREAATLVPELPANGAMFEREVDRLREELDLRSRPGLRPLCMEPAAPGNVDHAVAMIASGGHRVLQGEALAEALATAAADLRRWCGAEVVGRIDLDGDGRIASAAVEHVVPPPLEVPDASPGGSLATFLHDLEVSVDGAIWIGEEFDEGDRLVQLLWLGRAVRDKVGVVLRLISVATESGTTVLLAADTTLLPAIDSSVPVSLAVRPARVRTG